MFCMFFKEMKKKKKTSALTATERFIDSHPGMRDRIERDRAAKQIKEKKQVYELLRVVTDQVLQEQVSKMPTPPKGNTTTGGG